MLDVNLNFYPTQMAVLTCPANEILIGGSKAGGKSFILRWSAFLLAMYVPGIEIYFFRRRYSDLMSNHVYGPEGLLSMSENFIRAGKIAFNQTDKRLDFFHDNGKKTSRIFLRHVQHEQDMENYRGIEASAIFYDELSLFPVTIYNFLRTHCRLGGLHIDYEEVRKSLPFVYDGYFPRIVSGSNPGGIGHNWVKREFIDFAPPNTLVKMPPEKGGMNRMFIPSKVTDNIRLLENDPGYIDRVRGIGGPLVKAFLDGDWNIEAGGVVSDLWDSDVHVISPIRVPKNATIFRSMDWGTFHPSVIVYTLQTSGEELEDIEGNKLYFPKNSLIVLHEIYNWDGEDENVGNKKTATNVGKQIAEFESAVEWGHLVRSGPADNQIFRLDGEGVTLSSRIVDGFNSVVKPKDYVMNLFEPANQKSGSRVTGLGIMRNYLEGALKFHNENEDEKGLYFVNTVRHCISTIPDLPRSETNPEDAETKNVPDHAYDAVRYVCMACADEFTYLEVKGF